MTTAASIEKLQEALADLIKAAESNLRQAGCSCESCNRLRNQITEAREQLPS
jgi:type VI protein secretion system component VasF